MSEQKNRRYGKWVTFGIWAIVLLVIAPHVLSDFNLNLLGRFLAYALVALGLDLIWGYTGMLSLGQGLFFGIGAYCFAMYITLEQAGDKLPEFMGLYGVTQLPGFWQPFHSPVFALVMAVVLPMVIAAALGYMVFRSRVKGVYFSVITQALTAIVSLLLIGQQQLINGTNGLTISDSGTLFGYSLRDNGTKQAIYLVTVLCLGLGYLLCRWIIDSRFGRLLIAIRDDETRVRFAGYNPVTIKVIVFAISAGLAGLGGALFFPQGGIISPAALGIVPSIEMVIWVAVGGRATLVGAVVGAVLVNSGKSWISTESPDAWQFFVGALFVAIVLFFPEGFIPVLRTQAERLWTKLGKRSPATGNSVSSLEPELEIDAPQLIELGQNP